MAIGAPSLVMKKCDAFGIYVGNTAKRIKRRKRDLLELEKALLFPCGAITPNMTLKHNIFASFVAQIYVTLIGVVSATICVRHMGAKTRSFFSDPSYSIRRKVY